MDSVSHACFSYLTCRTLGPAATPRLGLAAAGVAVLPDLDFLLIPFLFVYRLHRRADGGLSWSMEKPGSYYNYGRLRNLARRVAGRIPPQRLASGHTNVLTARGAL